jgi:tRNA-splicing ligase RtcB
MINIDQIRRINDWQWEIPTTVRKDMRVPAYIFASHEILTSLLKDKSLEQLINVTTLPGIQIAALLMPDAHEGYGFPIGGVAATSYPEGVISPGGIGYDINCGVRLLRSKLTRKDIINHLDDLSKELYKQIPSGVGKGGPFKLKLKEVDAVLRKGVEWAIDLGYGPQEHLKYIESHGRLREADPGKVSSTAKKRGHDQLGTIGSGNHFVEIDRVGEIFDVKGALAMGLEKDQVVVLIHTGSRGLGHQNATDYIRLMMSKMDDYGIKIPDRELACLPLNSATGKDYFASMAAAANYAWCNREMITWEIQKAWSNLFGASGGILELVYDVAHNIAKIETHRVGKKLKKLIVHRKGATRAFGPQHEELPERYCDIGQPVLIPGSMGTSSYVLAGCQLSHEKSLGSACHGAGRRLSRRSARRQVRSRELQDELRERGIYIQAGSLAGIAEEAPIAYKDVNLVVESVHQNGLAKKVAKITPMAVIKG